MDIYGCLANAAGATDTHARSGNLPDDREDQDVQATGRCEKVQDIGRRLAVEWLSEDIVQTESIDEKAAVWVECVGCGNLDVVGHNCRVCSMRMICRLFNQKTYKMEFRDNGIDMFLL